MKQDFPAIKGLIHAVGINPTGLAWQRFIVAESADGLFVGCGQLKPHSQGVVELASIAVAASTRNQGLGSKIVLGLIREAERPLYLTCRAELGSFYQQFGFRVGEESSLPGYFRRIKRLAGLAHTLQLVNETLLVMVLD